MSAAAAPVPPRRAASPYARRLARERAVALGDLAGSGPGGRVLAADVLAFQAPVVHAAAERPALQPRTSVITFAAPLSLSALCRVTAEAARIGLSIGIEDIASRAARFAMAEVAGPITLEVDGRQVLLGAAPGLSIGAERRLRLAALDRGADATAEPAAASLLVLHAVRVLPVALPLLTGRSLRLVLVADLAAQLGHALLCADKAALSESGAIAVLGAFVATLEQPLGLLA